MAAEALEARICICTYADLRNGRAGRTRTRTALGGAARREGCIVHPYESSPSGAAEAVATAVDRDDPNQPAVGVDHREAAGGHRHRALSRDVGRSIGRD